jgi:hypothetical protein
MQNCFICLKPLDRSQLLNLRTFILRLPSIFTSLLDDLLTRIISDYFTNASGDKFFYRLKMLDIDSKYTFSNIQMVKRDGKPFNELVVVPNPIKDVIPFANWNYNKNATAELRIVDMQGRNMSIAKQKIGSGYNLIPLNISSLQAGSYILSITVEGTHVAKKIIIIH